MSYQTIAMRIAETSCMGRSLENIDVHFKCHDLVMNSSTDGENVATFTRGIEDKYEVTEEMASL